MAKTMKKSKFLLFYFLLFTFFPSSVFAQESKSNPGAESTEQQARTTDLKTALKNLNFFQVDIGVFLSKAVDAAIILAALLCLGYLLWGGIDWLLSEGDKQKYESARNKILHAVMGLAVVVTVWAGWKLILHFFGLEATIQTN